MTNFEKWKDEILKIKADDYEVAVRNGVPIPCVGICDQCEFEGTRPCIAGFVEWLLSEYKEPAPKLTKREREFLESFEYEYDKAISKTAGITYLRMAISEHEIHSEEIKSNMFPFIKPGKQWTFEELMKLEVEE